MNNEWYKDWFASEDYLDVYRHRNSEDTELLVNLILSNTNIQKEAYILDAACGAGRHAIKFAERGFNVTAFDLSRTLLQIGIDKAKENGIIIDFHNADLRNFSTEKKIHLVLSLFTSFGYFNSDNENFIFPKNAFHMLHKNGYYVLDYLNKNYIEDNLLEITEKVVNDKEIVENRTIADGRVVKKIKIKKANLSNEYVESVKLYSFDELSEKFSNIGYRVVNVFGDYFGNSFKTKTSERCIVFFQK